jgi:hypothetical protein
LSLSLFSFSLRRSFNAALCLWWATVFLCLLPFVSSSSQAAARRSDNHRYALVIGHNKGHRELKNLSFAENDARRFSRLLTELGDFPASQVKLLLSPTVQQLRKVMKSLKRRLDRVGKRGMFLLYYSGHSRPRHFQMGKERLRYATLLRFVKKLSIPLRIVIVDSCHSGSMINAKGKAVRVKGAVRVNFIRWTRRALPSQVQGLAILASSGEKERSYESDRLRSSFFTSSLLAGLRGAADRNKDRRVTLHEVYEYARRQTIAQSMRHKVPLQRPVFRWEIKGSAPLIITQLQRAEAQLSLQRGVEGHCFLFRNGKLVHEFEKKKSRLLVVGVRSGQYQIQLRRKGWLGVYRVMIRSRQRNVLRATDVKWYRLRSQKARALGNNEFSSSSMGILGHYTPMSQLSLNSVGLSLVLDARRWMRVGVRYSMSTSTPSDRPYIAHELSLPVALGAEISLYQFSLWGGALVQPQLSIRALTTTTDTYVNFGMVVGALGHLDYHLNPDTSLRLQVSGGAHLLFYDQAIKVAPAISVGIGLIWHP